mgnify:CR=1 FL=1
MNFKTTLVLLILLVGASIYLLVEKWRGERPIEDKPRAGEAKKILDLSSDAIGRVRMAWEDGTVELERVSDGWRLRKPVDAKAVGWQVDSLLSELTGARATGEVEISPDRAAAMGFEKPRLTIELQAGDRVTRVEIGRKALVGDDFYVRVDRGPRAWIVSSGPLYQRATRTADETADSLRDKKLLGADVAMADSLEIETADARFRFEKSGDDWRMTQPRAMPAEESKITGLLNALRDLEAQKFVAPGSSEAARVRLDPPRIRATFTVTPPASTKPTTRPAPVTVLIGPFVDLREESLYAGVEGSGVAARVSKWSIERLENLKLDDLRDRRVMNIDPITVSSIQIVREATWTRPVPRREYVIVRRTNPSTGSATAATEPAQPQWSFASGMSGEVDPRRVDAILGALRPLRVEKYLETPSTTPTTRPTPAAVLAVTTASAGGSMTTTHRLELFDESGTGPLVGEYDNLRFELNRTILEELDHGVKKGVPSLKLQRGGSRPPADAGGPAGLSGGMPPGF